MPRGGYRPGSGPKKGTKYKPRAPKGEPKAESKVDIPVPAENTPKTQAEDIDLTDPLVCLQSIYKDQTISVDKRIQAAGLALPFVHARKGEGKGKKDEQEEKAKNAGSGKFSPGKAPVRLVK